jgi:peptidoglycan/LPS O-acetylase OafA/YrhL
MSSAATNTIDALPAHMTVRAAKAGGQSTRLSFLDGVRALAALYVVVCHHVTDIMDKMGGTLRHASGWLSYGHYAVDVFIVLSGYCLMLPVVKTGATKLPHGVKQYIRARALRILPPYFAAVIFSMAVLAALGRFHELTVGDIVSHLLVIHNFSSHWVYSINSPLWSVAVEWQIYFTFPLLLLPLRRRLGAAACILGGVAVGMLPHLLLPIASKHHLVPQDWNLDWSYPWYIGLFAMGMIAAEQTYRKMPDAADRRFLRLLAGVGLAAFACVALVTLHGGSLVLHSYLVDMAMGAGSAAILIWCGRHVRLAESKKPLLVRLLSSRPLVALGVMSFSLYLVHQPMWLCLDPLVARFSLSAGGELAVRLILGVPVVVLLAYVFYLLVERPCLMYRARVTEVSSLPTALNSPPETAVAVA